MIHIDLDWKDHPVRRRGLYTSRNGVLEKLDTAYNFGDTYPFVLDGRTRSPYYDAECKRLTKNRVAIELDKDYAGASSRFFDGGVISRLLRETARDPLHTGSVSFDPDTLELSFIERPDGDFKLWVPLTRDGKGKLHPPQDTRYCVGNDLAGGGNTEWSANSAMAVLDKVTGIQAASFASKNIKPDRWGMLAIAVCRWLKGLDYEGAWLNWETNGLGGGMTSVIEHYAYGYVYFRYVKDEFTRKRTRKIGWHSKGDDKFELLGGVQGGGLAAAMESGRVTIRDADCLKEMPNFVNDGSKVQHSRAKTSDDPGSKGAAHGDRVIAMGTAVLGLPYKLVTAEEEVVEKGPEENSPDWKIEKALREAEARDNQRQEAFAW